MTREYVFQPGVKPSDLKGGRRGSSARCINREVFLREDGRWVVRWTTLDPK